MIRLNVFILIEETSLRQQVIEAATELVELSLHDQGVIDYEAFQSLTATDHFFICETWKDQQSLDRHMATDHFRRLVARLQELGTMTLEKFTF